MKNITILVLILLVSYTGFTQQTAFFETTIYVEDAMGNRDSVIVGHDSAANFNFNPEFGEVDISTPWDSVLEVRASHGDAGFYYDDPFPAEDVLSKKIIGNASEINTTYNCQLFKEPLLLNISQKYLPLKISWNTADFINDCNVGTFISPHQNPLIAFGWWNSPVALAASACMADTNELIITDFFGEWLDIYSTDQIEGRGLDTINTVLLFFANRGYPQSPCNRDLVSISPEPEIPDFALFPNPTSGLLHLESEARLNWKLFDTNGRLLKEGIEPQLDISIYPDGIYFLQVASIGGGPPTVRKVVKMEG